MNVLLLPPFTSSFPAASQWVGYPEYLAVTEHLLQSKREVNASCPGETSGSFLDIHLPDNGCNSPHQNPYEPAIKPAGGLHTNYSTSQMAFVLSELANNKHINRVTLSIGANDLFLVEPQLMACGADMPCIQGVLGPVLQAYAQNLTGILTGIRSQYRGTLILLTYYSPDPSLDAVIQALNGTMVQVAAGLAAQPGFVPVLFADGFAAFRAFGPNACDAGLLVQFPPNMGLPPCDVHPSALGQSVLAATVDAVWRSVP